jgi:hypothetical protein
MTCFPKLEMVLLLNMPFVVLLGRADPDFTKKLIWQTPANLTFQDMGKQVVMPYFSNY